MAERPKSERVAPQEVSDDAPEAPTFGGTPESPSAQADAPEYKVSHDFNRVSVGGVDFEDGQVVDANDAALLENVPDVKVEEV